MRLRPTHPVPVLGERKRDPPPSPPALACRSASGTLPPPPPQPCMQEHKRDLAGAVFERTRPVDGRQIRIDDVKLLMQL